MQLNKIWNTWFISSELIIDIFWNRSLSIINWQRRHLFNLKTTSNFYTIILAKSPYSNYFTDCIASLYVQLSAYTWNTVFLQIIYSTIYMNIIMP
jgi:ABC-type multidrug transport system permease subunit